MVNAQHRACEQVENCPVVFFVLNFQYNDLWKLNFSRTCARFGTLCARFAVYLQEYCEMDRMTQSPMKRPEHNPIVQESLISDERDGFGPTEFVQQKLQSLLTASWIPVCRMHTMREVRRYSAE